MKMKNRISRLMKAAALGMAMAAMAASVSAVSVKAEESLIVEMDQYRTEDGKLFIYANHNKGTDFDVDMQESSVEVAKQSLPIEEVKKFSEVKEPVSYMFMVDISGSMDKSRIDMIRETLHRFIDMKRPADNFCISTMGNEIISTGFSEDTAVLKSFVDEIAVTRQDTDLYTSIKEELNILKTDKSVHLKRCLIIFSDGADDQAGGITRDEAEAQVRESHIPVFTVALLPQGYREADIESAKVLGGFARYSAGGVHYAPAVDGTACIDVYDKITETMDNSLVVTADLADVVASDGNIYIGVVLSDGVSKDDGGMEIPSGNILEAIKEAQSMQNEIKEAPPEEKAPVPVTEPVEAEAAPNHTLLFLIIGIAAVIIIFTVILLAVRKKRKEETDDTDDMQEAASNVQADGMKTVGLNQNAAAPVAANAPKITLFKIKSKEDEKYELQLDVRRSIGRKKSCDLSFENDNSLSGIHCYLYCIGKKVYVKDNASTNGTYINGVPITDEYSIENGDILLIGAAEYRIVYE